MANPDLPSPSETEIRFRLQADSLPRLEAHPAFHPTRATTPETVQQVTTYFDTPDFGLASRGISLRIRQIGDHRIQTVKWKGYNGSAAFSRGEIEWAINGCEPDLSLIAETCAGVVLDEAGETELRPIFVTEVERIRRYLLPEADTVIEAALDRGTLAAGSVREDIQELELELKAGCVAQLCRLALDLHGTV